MWPTEIVPGLGLIDEDVGLLRVGVCDILAQDLIGLIRTLVPIIATSFPEAHHQKLQS
jgi:hypothetical protein